MNDRKKVMITIGVVGILIDEAQAQALIQQNLVTLCGSCPNYHLTALAAVALATTKFSLDLSSVIDAEPAPLDPAQQQRFDEILKGDRP